MPRPRKPVDMQKGNLTVINGQKRKAEEASVTVGKNQLKTAPKWLINDNAKKEWRRIIKELSAIELIGNLDYNNLGAYCNAYANYVETTNQLRGETYTIARETRNGEIIVKNPLIDIQKYYAEEMRKFAALCGLTIDSRLKAAGTRKTKKEEGFKEKWGNI